MNGDSLSRYGLGVAALIVVGGSLGLAAVSLRRRYLADSEGAGARLAETVIGLALLTAMLELLGTLGWFRLAPIILASAAIGLAGWRSLPRAAGAPAAAALPPSPPGGRPWLALASVGIIAVVAGGLAAEWSAPTLQSYDVGIRTFDSLWYHLPWAAWFAQSGHITPLRFTDVEYLTPFYPATAELYHGLGIVLLGHDTLSPAINLAWLGLVLLAAYCVGRPYGIGPLSLLGAALALATPMMTLSQAGSAANDIAGVFFLLAAVALLPGGPRGAHAPSAGSPNAALTLAAVAAGFAVGVKLTLVAPVLALTLGAIWLAPRGQRRRVAVRWTGTAFLAGGFWYVRNLIAVGNPLPWLNLPGLAAPDPPLQQHTGFSVAHYLTDTHIWSTVFGPGLKSGLGPWWPAVLAATLAGPLLCLFGGDRRRVLGLVGLASLAAYLITPEGAAGPAGHPTGFAFNLRYAAPALVLSLTLLPLTPAFGGRRRPLTAVALGLVTVATLTRSQLWPARHTLGVVLVGVAVGLVVLARVAAQRMRRPPPALTVALAAGLVIAVAAAGYGWQHHYLRGRYQFNPGVSSLARVWALFRDKSHVRVGIVGTFGGFFAYPLYGATDSNPVQYIAQHGPHGSFTPITSCRRWRTAVNAGHFRYLVTTPARDPWHPKQLHFSPEGAWTASDPAARLIYRRRATGQPISVFVLSGSLDPAGCRRR